MPFAVVNTDNFGSDYPDEKFVFRGIRSRYSADRIADAVNEEFCNDDHSPRFWKVVEEPYKLAPGFEP